MISPTPRYLTTAELAKATAGGDDYIRTKNNEVRGLALRLDINPDAPDVIIFGTGPRIKQRAQLFLDSGRAVPAYVKRDSGKWEYLGEYRATAIRRDKATIDKYTARRSGYTGGVSGVLFLESTAEPKVQVSGGGFADTETRREIEAAAIGFVTRQLAHRGFRVEDHQRENRGYDLLAVSASSRLLIEVKGTDCNEPRFFLSRNERRCSAEAEWRLFVVCGARFVPCLSEFTADEMHRKFKHEALAWECTPISS